MSKSQTILVRCKKGLTLPIPVDTIIDSARKYATDGDPVRVKNNSFIRRRLRAGDLELVKPTPLPKAKKAKV